MMQVFSAHLAVHEPAIHRTARRIRCTIAWLPGNALTRKSLLKAFGTIPNCQRGIFPQLRLYARAS
jgi:hypothetical protein